MEKVILSIYWPDSWKKVVLSPSDWRKIKRGKPFLEIGKGFWYEGIKFRDYWEFNKEFKGSCIVTYDEGEVGFEGSILDCKIEEIENRKYLNLEKFLKLYESFLGISTWTKQKHTYYNELTKYLNSCRSDLIKTSRDSSSTLIKSMNTFTIFKVNEKKNGVLKQYRGRWVLMYMAHRRVFNYNLKIYPLIASFDSITNQNLKKRFSGHYIDNTLYTH